MDTGLRRAARRNRIGKETHMSGRFSYRHRLVQCPRCRRQLAADCSVCPHCAHRRARKLARTPVRAVVVVVLALLAIGGYVYLGEPGFDARTFISR
ncbi:hypothetical protein A9R05_23385 [Burkholderia sp. KK1]|nr:hypothetical protein A9R05_23385 [Burkholderia sp. KK1]